MKKIFWKIFLPVLLAMVTLIIVGVFIVVNYSGKQLEDIQRQVPEIYEQAKETLLVGNESDLINWLEKINKEVTNAEIFIVNHENREILNRSVPSRSDLIRNRDLRRERNAWNADQRKGTRRRGEPRSAFERPSNRRDRFPFLFSNNGAEFRIIFSRPKRGLRSLARSQSFFFPILLTILALSGLVSWLLARNISQPVQRLRLGVQRIAQGNLHDNVALDLKNRQDEIGKLANDFDQMAKHISQLLASQQHLLRDVSHELRSPLARLQVALGLAEMRLQKLAGAEMIQPELNQIETEVNTLNTMIGKLLSLVNIKSLNIDKSELKWQEKNLVAILDSTIQNANYEAQNKQVTVKLSAPSESRINLLPDLMRSALDNIIRNAIRHASKNSTVIVSLESHATHHLIQISNQGERVPVEALEKIFEPFYRVSQVREHLQGTGGIGLAIAKQAVKLHNGKIWAENMEQGFCVSIQIPAH